MSLTALHGAKMATVTVTVSTVAGLLDHIYTCITAANDYAGTALPSPLTGVTKYQNAGTTEAIYGSFTTAGITQKFLVAGVNAARTPKMGGSHTWSASMLMMGVTKNAGAFASWDHATAPFTSGDSTGLVKFFDAGTITATKIHAIITAESLHIYIERATNLIYGGFVGSIIDPETTTAGSSETDGRMVGVCVGGTGVIASTFHTTSSTWLNHAASNNSVHFLVFDARASTVQTAQRDSQPITSTTTTCVNADNEPFATAIYVQNTSTGKRIGRLREVCLVRDAKHAQVQAPAGVDAWHYVGGSTASDQDCVGVIA